MFTCSGNWILSLRLILVSIGWIIFPFVDSFGNYHSLVFITYDVLIIWLRLIDFWGKISSLNFHMVDVSYSMQINFLSGYFIDSFHKIKLILWKNSEPYVVSLLCHSSFWIIFFSQETRWILGKFKRYSSPYQESLEL